MAGDILDYEGLAATFNQALLHTLRKHSVADTFLDYWVPDADPVLGIAGMVDSARIAGHPALSVRFKLATVAEGRLAELERAVSRFYDVTIERQGDSVVLHAAGMIASAEEASARGQRRAKTKPRYWSAEMAPAGPAIGAAPATRWTSGELPEFADAHPHFRAAMKAASAGLSHEGGAVPEDAALKRLQVLEGAVRLTLDVDPVTHTVRRAGHDGGRTLSERVALDLFCRMAETLPIQEVADHVGLKVVDSLVDEDKPPPVVGVLLPINAGQPFTLAPRLARKAYDAYRASMSMGTETNFHYAPPSSGWLALTAPERREKVVGGLRGFLQSADLYPDDIELLRLEKNKYGYEVRGVIAFSDRVAVGDKPVLMRRLERRLRRDLETEIELVADRARDSSPLRRLLS